MIEFLHNPTLILLLLCCMVFGFVVTLNNLATPLRTLNLTDSALILAIVSSTYPLAGALLSIVSGVLADWSGRQRMMLSGFFFFTSGFLVLSQAPHWGWLLLGQALLGLGDVSFWIAAYALLTELAPPRRQYAVQGLGAAATSIGRILGPFIAGELTASIGFTPTFLVGTSLSLAGFIMVLCMRALPQREPHNGSLIASVFAYHRAVWQLLAGNRAVQWVSALHVVGLFSWPAMGGAFYVLFLTTSGRSPSEIGLIRSAQQATSALAQLGLAQTQSLPTMPLFALVATAISGLTIGATPLLGSVPSIFLVACLGGASNVRSPMLHGFAAENTEQASRSMWFALHNLIWAVMNPAIILLAGILVERVSLSGAFLLCGTFVAVSTFVLWIWARRVSCIATS
jgi:MFS family permease